MLVFLFMPFSILKTFLNFQSRHHYIQNVLITSVAHSGAGVAGVGGQQFQLVLRRDSDTINPNAVVEQPSAVPQPFSVDHLVHGMLTGQCRPLLWFARTFALLETVRCFFISHIHSI